MAALLFRGAVVVVFVVLAGSIFKFLDAFAHAAHQLGNFAAAKQQQYGQHDQGNLPGTQCADKNGGDHNSV